MTSSKQDDTPPAGRRPRCSKSWRAGCGAAKFCCLRVRRQRPRPRLYPQSSLPCSEGAGNLFRTMPVIHLRVVGKVQGVGFRWFVRERAEALGVAGWVRNTASGEVEVAASGDPSKLADLEQLVTQGPPGSKVIAVHHVPAPNGTSYPSPFRIGR